MGLTDSYAYFLPVHALYQIVSIKLCHNSRKKHKSNRGIYPTTTTGRYRVRATDNKRIHRPVYGCAGEIKQRNKSLQA